MYELNKVNDKIYYINCPAKIGIYKISENDIYLIDSGNDSEMGRKILKIINENNWHLLGIINTHSNADHVGGNHFLQTRTNCKIISSELENAITKFPILESSFLYGGYPCKSLRNKFLMAEASIPTNDIKNYPIDDLEYISLGGHFFDMIGIKINDVCFLADSLFGENIINKYHFFFIYDVRKFLETLDKIELIDAKIFIPAHADATNNIKPLIELNRNKVYEIIDIILDFCKQSICFEDLLKKLFDHYNLILTIEQYALVGSTIKSYLSYLNEENKIEIIFENNKMYWKSIA